MGRILGPALATLATFAAVAVVMVRLSPQPMRDTDYLVAGSVATLAALLALFLALVFGPMKSRDVFFKRRRKRR
jgi:membrane associated rhomboid family serine protease